MWERHLAAISIPLGTPPFRGKMPLPQSANSQFRLKSEGWANDAIFWRKSLKDVIANRIENVRKALADAEIDTLMVLVAENRYYLSGYTGEDSQFDETAGALFISGDELILATDPRFDTQAGQEAPLYDIVCYKKGLAQELPEILKRLGTSRLGFESVRLSCQQYNKMKTALSEAGIDTSLVPVEEIVENLRVIKTEDEIEATRKSLAIAEDAFEATLALLEPGMTETEGAWQLEIAVRERGGSGMSFPTICATGRNSALPHAIPGDAVFQEGDPLLFDWGVFAGHYCSDTTRTVVLGQPDDQFKKVYTIVREAQKRAVSNIRDGASTKSVDAAARDYIESTEFKGKFAHGLGHGTGLAVHEAPRLNTLRDDELKAGMIVTVEPGIYLPEWGGIRLENQVVVREDGAEVLNRLGFLEF
jgi:Xaa-Pro aminopeptidase